MDTPPGTLESLQSTEHGTLLYGWRSQVCTGRTHRHQEHTRLALLPARCLPRPMPGPLLQLHQAGAAMFLWLVSPRGGYHGEAEARPIGFLPCDFYNWIAHKKSFWRNRNDKTWNSETISSLPLEETSQLWTRIKQKWESPNSTQVPASSHGLVVHPSFHCDKAPNP